MRTKIKNYQRNYLVSFSTSSWQAWEGEGPDRDRIIIGTGSSWRLEDVGRRGGLGFIRSRLSPRLKYFVLTLFLHLGLVSSAIKFMNKNCKNITTPYLRLDSPVICTNSSDPILLLLDCPFLGNYPQLQHQGLPTSSSCCKQDNLKVKWQDWEQNANLIRVGRRWKGPWFSNRHKLTRTRSSGSKIHRVSVSRANGIRPCRSRSSGRNIRTNRASHRCSLGGRSARTDDH